MERVAAISAPTSDGFRQFWLFACRRSTTGVKHLNVGLNSSWLKARYGGHPLAIDSLERQANNNQ
jgi:hypothetical protein